MLTDTREPSAPPHATTATPSSNRLHAWAALAVLVAFAAASYRQVVPPPVVPATAPAAEFSAERALTVEREIARRPHPTGSPESARVRGYLQRTLAGLGLQPQVQTATGVSTVYPAAGTVHNLVGRLRGTGGGPTVMLVAHYDGVAAGPAASDDAAGVAAIVETVRALRAGPRLRGDVVVLLTDGEEDGLLGAAAFAAHHPWMRDVSVALNFEARGSAGPSLMFETGARNAAVVRALSAAPSPVASSLFFALYRLLRNDTDVSELKRTGVQALNFAFVGGEPAYHSGVDDLARQDLRSVQHHGAAALTLTRELAGGSVAPTASHDAVFFTVAGMVVSYPAGLALPLALLAGVALLVVLAIGIRRGELSVRHTAAGAGMVLLALVVAALAEVALAFLIAAVHRPLGGDPLWAPVYAVAGVALALAVALTAWRVALRRLSPAALLAGAGLVWLASTVAVSAVLPAASYLFLWPLVFGSAALAAAVFGRDVLVRRVATLAVGLAAALPVLALVVPVLALLYLLAGASLPVLLAFALLVVLASAALAVPLAPAMRELPAALPVAALAACAGATVLGMATVRFDAGHPRPANLVYAASADSGVAATVLRGSAPGAWGARFVDRAARPLPAPLAAVLGGKPEFYRAGPSVALQPAAVRVTADSLSGTGRVLTLELAVAPDARALDLSIPGVQPTAVAVNGEPVRTEGYRIHPSGDWTYTYFNPELGLVRLRLELPTRSPVTLRTVTSWSGVPAAVGLAAHPRPADIVPAGLGDRTIVSRSFVLAPAAN